MGEYSGATNYNFMTGLIRNEWGFKGYVVTDAWMPCKDYWPLDMLVRAGTNAPLENAGARTEKNESYLLSGIWDAAENCVKIKDGTTVSYTQWYCVRTLAQQEFYTQSNMNPMNNVYDLTAFAGKELSATQAAEFEAILGADRIASDKVIYALEGELPEGLSFSTADGKLSGKNHAAILVLAVRPDQAQTIVEAAAGSLSGNSQTAIWVTIANSK